MNHDNYPNRGGLFGSLDGRSNHGWALFEPFEKTQAKLREFAHPTKIVVQPS